MRVTPEHSTELRLVHSDEFSTYYPAIVFGFFIMAVVLAVVAMQPVFQACGFVCAAAYWLCVRGRAGWRMIAALLPVFVVLAAINPLFNPRGDTVLFTWFDGRPYTFEALLFGASTAAMFCTVILWFASYSRVFTTDRFTYLFGAFAPALTLVFTMVLRLVPTYKHKTDDIAGARACVGCSPLQGNLRDRAQQGSSTLSALTSWALEGAVVAADSMRSRGYGAGARTSFANIRFTTRDALITGLLIALGLCALVCLMCGSADIEYFPRVVYAPVSWISLVGFVAYMAFLSTPVVIDVREALIWRILLSKM